MGVIYVTRDEALNVVTGKILEADVVLDIGAGIRPQKFIDPFVHICVEPHLPYIERLRQEVGDDPTYVFLNCTWDVAMRLLPPKSVDIVFALDVIEHLRKEDGFKLLQEAQRIARRQIMVFTPLGFAPQSYDDSNRPDRWGMDGGYWQAHRAGWQSEDFGESWDLVCCESYHLVDQNEQPLEKPLGAIWAFLNLSADVQSRAQGLSVFSPQYKRIIKACLKRFLPLQAYNGVRAVWGVAAGRRKR